MGTGDCAVPTETATYRCARQVDDVEALRKALGPIRRTRRLLVLHVITIHADSQPVRATVRP